jgi:hypothetical protein
MRVRALRALALAALVVALLVARVLVAAHGEYAQAVSAERAGQLDAAIVHYRRAIGWYAPGSPYGARAIAALSALAEHAQQQGDTARALAAQRAMAGGIASARSFFTPHQSALELAQQKAGVTTKSPADPSPFFSFTAVLGWLAFVGSAFGLVLRGVDAEGRFAGAARWGGGLALGLAVFAFSLWLA